MKKLSALVCILLISCQTSDNKLKDKTLLISAIDQTVATWHQAAAEANFEAYFSLMTEDAIFIGTDATEKWDKKAFQDYAKPHFDRGKAWTFHTLERSIYLSEDQKTAWFDELLDTSFKICRGSGTLVFEKNSWRIKHYVLSFTIPNALSKTIVNQKDSIENVLIQQYKN